MKIAISTLIGYYNYGNRLQNYALQEILKKMGNDVVTIKDYSDITGKVSLKEKIVKAFKKGNLFKRLLGKLDGWSKKRNSELEITRENNFKKFTNDYINETKFYINQDTTDFSFDEKIDCYIIGSDQVWNYLFMTSFFYGFVEYSDKPKLSYAASFGVDTIPRNYIADYRKGLDSLDFISVRESRGTELVKNIDDRESTVVLDPTLLLSKNDWKKLIKNNKKYDEKYVLTYFLDSPTKETLKYINDYSSSKGLVIKSLYDIDFPDLWVADPSEFVNLISQSEAVFTDSFHGSVFSIIFEKYFEVFERNNKGPKMNSRIDTLLKDLGILDRWHDSTRISQGIKYSEVKYKLCTRREQSLNYLQESLNSVGKVKE